MTSHFFLGAVLESESCLKPGTRDDVDVDDVEDVEDDDASFKGGGMVFRSYGNKGRDILGIVGLMEVVVEVVFKINCS